jgi:thymidine kinase
MVKLLVGDKGAGKTKALVKMAKEANEASDGVVVFVTTKDKHMLEFPHNVRYVNAKTYKLETLAGIEGFVKGLLAGNYDIEKVFVDRLYTLIQIDDELLEKIVKDLEGVSERNNVDFYLTMSKDPETLPENLKAYQIAY